MMNYDGDALSYFFDIKYQNLIAVFDRQAHEQALTFFLVSSVLLCHPSHHHYTIIITSSFPISPFSTLFFPYSHLNLFRNIIILTIQISPMPKVVDNYVFQRKIGSGQYGDVFKGYNKADNSDIAIKAIKRENIKGKFLQLLQNEIKVLKTCDNRNIIKLYDIKKTANNFYLILEYCNEGDLSQYLKKNKTLSQKQAVEFFIQILNAFKTLNKHKIMHRDFKLANILMHDGEIKIADFGFSKLLTNQEFTETMLGSPLNMAPEVLGGTQYNSKADIWSIGVVFYQMLFGSPPYKAANMVQLVNNIKNKPLRFPRDINSISDVTEDILRRMLTVDPNKRIQWENLYHHPINSFLEDQIKKDLEDTMKEGQDLTLNASKFYLKANMVVDHPKQIEKNENINNYAYDVVHKKKQGGFNGQMIKREGTRKKELQATKETLRSTEQKTEVDKSQKDIIGDEQTLREKQIKAFKKNSKYLLHRRNIYVFLASVAEQAMDLGKEIKFSDVVGYLLIKKLLQLLGRLKQLMERKELKELKQLQFWQLFQGEKDFKDIQLYVWKEYDVFRVFYESVHARIKDKIKYFDEETQAILSSQNTPLSEKVYQRHLRQYIRGLYEIVRGRQFKTQSQERKLFIHLQRMVDCLNVEDVFQFERNGVIFNFHNYYEEPQRTELDRIKKDLQKKMNVI